MVKIEKIATEIKKPLDIKIVKIKDNIPEIKKRGVEWQKD